MTAGGPQTATSGHEKAPAELSVAMPRTMTGCGACQGQTCPLKSVCSCVHTMHAAVPAPLVVAERCQSLTQ